MASKLRGLNIREYLQPRNRAHAEVAVWILLSPILSLRGEGRCIRGRNEKMHSNRHRGRGSDISRKISRDNAGKDLLSAGACGNLQRLGVQDDKSRRTEIIGLAHKFVVAINTR